MGIYRIEFYIVFNIFLVDVITIERVLKVFNIPKKNEKKKKTTDQPVHC